MKQRRISPAPVIQYYIRQKLLEFDSSEEKNFVLISCNKLCWELQYCWFKEQIVWLRRRGRNYRSLTASLPRCEIDQQLIKLDEPQWCFCCTQYIYFFFLAIPVFEYWRSRWLLNDEKLCKNATPPKRRHKLPRINTLNHARNKIRFDGRFFLLLVDLFQVILEQLVDLRCV